MCTEGKQILHSHLSSVLSTRHVVDGVVPYTPCNTLLPLASLSHPLARRHLWLLLIALRVMPTQMMRLHTMLLLLLLSIIFVASIFCYIIVVGSHVY